MRRWSGQRCVCSPWRRERRLKRSRGASSMSSSHCARTFRIFSWRPCCFLLWRLRRTKLAEYQILYWKDLPSQVRARDGSTQIKKALPERFQRAIDARATIEGATSEEAYLAGWRWGEWRSRDGAAQRVLDQVVAELEA